MTGAGTWGSRLCLAAQLAGLGAGPCNAWGGDTPAGAPAAVAAEGDSTETRNWTSRKGNGSTWGVVGSAAGILAGAGLAVWVKSEADERYEAYLRTADPEAAAELLDSAERYDRTALLGFAVAQVSFVAFVYFLTRGDDRELVPVQGEPILRLDGHGAQVGWRFRP